jgi:hypothetical protein
MNQHIPLRRMTGVAAVAVGLLIATGSSAAALGAADPESVDITRAAPERQINRGRIQFAPGATSGSVNGAVSRGDWHHWAARAFAGQTMEVTITADSGNATFELYTPSGDQMANDVRSFSGTLPQSGDYAIDVGSTGGLANYTLTLTITGEPAAPLTPPTPGHLPGHNRGSIDLSEGFNSVTGTVARGDWHHWAFRAQAGQPIQVMAGGNATFELYTPSGDQMANDVTQFEGAAPATGLYAVDIGSTGGTANYTLAVVLGDVPAPAPPPGQGQLPGHRQGSIDLSDGSGVASGSVARGDWHEWTFRSPGGQTLSMVITAAAGNATFSLYEPDGDVLAAHTRSFTGTLATAGFYMIEVGSTGGTADYTLSLTVS